LQTVKSPARRGRAAIGNRRLPHRRRSSAAVSLGQRNVLLGLARWPPSPSPLPDCVLPRHDARRLHRRLGPCGRVVVAAVDAAARRISPALPRGPRPGTHQQLRCAGAAPRTRLRCRAVSTHLTSRAFAGPLLFLHRGASQQGARFPCDGPSPPSPSGAR
jgi:hypothetical protein